MENYRRRNGVAKGWQRMRTRRCLRGVGQDQGSTHLREAAVEAGSPATLGTGGPTAQALSAQDAVTALGVGTPGQVGAALHIATQKGLLIL